MSYQKLLDSRIEQAYSLLFILAFLKKQDWIEEKALIEQFAGLSVSAREAHKLISYLYKEKLLSSRSQRKSFFRFQYLYHISPEGEELLKYYCHKYHLPLTQMLWLASDSPELK